MAQLPAEAKSQHIAKNAVAASPKARLILQDPLAFDQATQPVLRASMELVAEPTVAGMEREQARNLWEGLNLEPEIAQARQVERKKLLLGAENSARELALAKTKALELQVQLTTAQDERLNHPVVYAGAASLVGFTVLWCFERRKRRQLEQRELEMLAQQTPSLLGAELVRSATTSADAPLSYLPQQGRMFSLEDSPDLANDFATDLLGSPDSQLLDVNEPEFVAQPIATPIPVVAAAQLESGKPIINKMPVPQSPGWAQPIRVDFEPQDDLPATPRRQEGQGLLAASKQVLGNMLSRRSERSDFNSTVLPSENPSSSNNDAPASVSLIYEQVDDATKMLYDEEAQEAFEQELLAHQLSAGLHANFDRSHDDVNSRSRVQMSTQIEESTMEYLLELRTAVSGLCALGRFDAAAKLLEEHIAEDPNACAWVYLEHLNLCEQAGMRKNFEAMRKCYLQQFNCEAPSWHEPGVNVLSLDSYTRDAAELCAAWSQGVMHTRTVVASWLAGPLRGRKLMQLPAYHDLFDMYELLEHVDAISGVTRPFAAIEHRHAGLVVVDQLLDSGLLPDENAGEESEFIPTVSLLDLDFEFSSDVTFEESEVQQSEKAVTVVKPGNFSVDFNVAGTQVDVLSSVTVELPKN